MYHLTIVDDAYDNLESYKKLLESQFKLELIQDPYAVMDFLHSNKTDLIILDLHMPKVSGFELFEKIREHYQYPVIFLSADPSEDVRIQGLDLGAEDFISKPVSIKELIARINNKISTSQNHEKNGQTQTSKKEVIEYPGFRLDCELQTAEIGDNRVQLTPIEYKLVALLAKNPNKVFSREYIAQQLWPNIHVQNQNIDTHLSNLRRKLKPFSENIKTIKQRGYILRY